MGMITSVFRNKIINGSRYLLVYKLSSWIPFLLVTEYPRSGGTWLGQLLSGYLGIPFPRNSFPKMGMSVVHGHYLPGRDMDKLKKIFWLHRDGRDVMVSLYYHYLFPNEENMKNPKDLVYYRKQLGFSDYHDIRTNLPLFMEFVFTNRPSKAARFYHEGNWADFNRTWLECSENNSGFRGNVIRMSYESLLADTQGRLAHLIREWTGESPDMDRIARVTKRFSFSAQTSRDPGSEDVHSFRRKGRAGDWKDRFSPLAAEVFNHYAGDVLDALGYEKDGAGAC